jgi:PilZ domain-containing protein
MTDEREAQENHPPTNARDGPRIRIMRRGRIVLNRRHSSFDVGIRDLSSTGAKLKLTEIWAVPETFELQILKPDGSMELIVPCEKRWQTGILVGAKFVRPPRP